MRRRGRHNGIPTIEARLDEAERAECRLAPFTATELGLVDVRGPGGLVRVGTPAEVPRPTPSDSEVNDAWARLEKAGYLRRGEPEPGEPTWPWPWTAPTAPR